MDAIRSIGRRARNLEPVHPNTRLGKVMAVNPDGTLDVQIDQTVSRSLPVTPVSGKGRHRAKEGMTVTVGFLARDPSQGFVLTTGGSVVADPPAPPWVPPPEVWKTFELRGVEIEVTDPVFEMAEDTTYPDVYLGGVYDYEETGGTHNANATYWTSTYAGIDTSGGPRDGDPIYLFQYYGTLLAWRARRVRKSHWAMRLFMIDSNGPVPIETLLNTWTPNRFTVAQADAMATANNGFPTYVGVSYWQRWQASGVLYSGFDHSTNDGAFLTPVWEESWIDASFSVNSLGTAVGTATLRARAGVYEDPVPDPVPWTATQGGVFST